MHAGDAEQAEIGGDVLGRLDRRRTAGDRRVLEDPAAEQEEFRPRVVEQGGGDGGAVGDHRAGELGRERPGDGQSGGAAVEDQRAARPHQARRDRGDLPLPPEATLCRAA